MRVTAFSFCVAFTFTALISLGQLKSYPSLDSFPEADINWYNKDFDADFIVGSGVDRTYKELLAGKKSRKVIVAVLDCGIDVKHPDLEGKIWVNDREIDGNGKDDDNNGYIDDINGWNFLGNKKGQNVFVEVYEPVRIVSELDSVMINYASIDVVPDSLKQKYELYTTARKIVNDKRAEFKRKLARIDTLQNEIAYCERVIARVLGKKNNTPAEICAVQSEDVKVMEARDFLCGRYAQGQTTAGLNAYKKYLNGQLDEIYNVNFKPRRIIGDNPRNINDRNYGNPDVKGPGPEHGTFVAGIIAANRNNSIGTMGVADNVEIMCVRTVPDGDEDDKDVALGIRYAVDNGARVINMSFGKDFSLRKPFVDSALVYAQSKNVLLVHSSGNSAANLDKETNYPTNVVNDTLTVESWLNVGAHSRTADLDFVGEFSNYGRRTVDLFAPGVQIVSLAPNGEYAQADGTSFAAPVVSGVAALIWSYYPNLTAIQIKEIISKSVLKQDELKVYLPEFEEKKKKVKFHNLSKTGGIISAYEAIKLAEEMSRAPIPGAPTKETK